MVYSSQNAAFSRDKQQFFSRLSTGTLDNKINVIDHRVQNTGYTFLLQNQTALETEFIEMFAVLQKQRDQNKEAFWLYCYYSASLLEAFYKAYSQHAKEQEYIALKEKIKARLHSTDTTQPLEADELFIDSLQTKFVGSIKSLITTPFHLSQIRDNVAYANLCRIYWLFCRLTLTQGLNIARDLKLIDKLDVILGTHTDVDKIIAVFQAPIGVINYFSVGFFLARFLIDGGLLIKHTFFPTEEEKGAENGCTIHKMDRMPSVANIDDYRNSYILLPIEGSNEVSLYYVPRNGKEIRLALKDKEQLKASLLQKFSKDLSIFLPSNDVKDIITVQTGHIPETTTRLDRFKHELYKRHCNFANDLVWATVNFLTNFNQVTQISGPVAGYLTAVFLTFDVCMVLYKLTLAKQEYLTKKAQYVQEKEDYNNPELFKTMSAEEKLAHLELLDKQLIELEINWQTKESNFYFVAAAAALLAIGFTASMLLSPPLLVMGCFFVCQLAVAMYLSSGAYAQYKEKSLYLEQANLTGKDLALAQKEYEKARNDFIFTMVKNAIVPTVLIATFAICWPAAIVLTALYIGYEIFHAHNQHSDGNAAKKLALAAPEEDMDSDSLLLQPI